MSHFLPPKEIAPKSMAVAVFAFLFALLGGLIGFISQSLLGVNAITYIGVVGCAQRTATVLKRPVR